MTTQPIRRPPVTPAERAALGDRLLERDAARVPVDALAAATGLPAEEVRTLLDDAAGRRLDALVVAGGGDPVRTRRRPVPQRVPCRGGLSDLVVAGRR